MHLHHKHASTDTCICMHKLEEHNKHKHASEEIYQEQAAETS